MDPPETGRGSLVIRGAHIGNLWASLLDKCADRYKSKSKSNQRHIVCSCIVQIISTSSSWEVPT